MMNYWCLLCAVLLSLIKCGTCSRQHLAFAGNKGGFPSLPNPFAPPPPTPEISKEENGRAVLKSLGLKSSTEPLAFYTDPERVVDITCAFMPVSENTCIFCFIYNYLNSELHSMDCLVLSL